MSARKFHRDGSSPAIGQIFCFGSNLSGLHGGDAARAASATGEQGAASATGPKSVALAAGYEGKAKASEGCAIFLVRRNDEYEITHVFASKVGDNGIKADVFYMLNDQGAPIEVEA